MTSTTSFKGFVVEKKFLLVSDCISFEVLLPSLLLHLKWVQSVRLSIKLCIISCFPKVRKETWLCISLFYWVCIDNVTGNRTWVWGHRSGGAGRSHAVPLCSGGRWQQWWWRQYSWQFMPSGFSCSKVGFSVDYQFWGCFSIFLGFVFQIRVSCWLSACGLCGLQTNLSTFGYASILGTKEIIVCIVSM